MGLCEVGFSDASDDADPVEFFNVTTPRARKEHHCHECRDRILPGETYHRVAYKFEGDLGCDRVCDPCWEAMQEFEYRIFGGDFWAEMREAWDGGAHVTACVTRLTTVAAKMRMVAEWRKWKGLATA